MKKLGKKNPQVVYDKSVTEKPTKNDDAENKQIARTKIFKGTAETKDVPPNDGARPVLKKQYDKISGTARTTKQVKQGMW